MMIMARVGCNCESGMGWVIPGRGLRMRGWVVPVNQPSSMGRPTRWNFSVPASYPLACSGFAQNVSLSGIGRRLRMRGLGDNGDGGGDFGGGTDFTGTDFGGSTSFFDSGATAGGSPLPADSSLSPADQLFLNTGVDVSAGNVPVDTAPTSQLPYQDITSGLPAGSTIDAQTGAISLSDGSYIGATGEIITADGTGYFPDGSKIMPDGTYVDANGNVFPPGSPQAQAAGSGIPSGGGGGGSSGGGPKGSSGSGSSNAQQMLCLLNPTLPQCRTAAAAGAATRKPASSGTTFSSWISQNWSWIAVGLGVVVLAPPLIDAITDTGGRRR